MIAHTKEASYLYMLKDYKLKRYAISHDSNVYFLCPSPFQALTRKLNKKSAMYI